MVVEMSWYGFVLENHGNLSSHPNKTMTQKQMNLLSNPQNKLSHDLRTLVSDGFSDVSKSKRSEFPTGVIVVDI